VVDEGGARFLEPTAWTVTIEEPVTEWRGGIDVTRRTTPDTADLSLEPDEQLVANQSLQYASTSSTSGVSRLVIVRSKVHGLDLSTAHQLEITNLIEHGEVAW
jgi:hypothetical protein